MKKLLTKTEAKALEDFVLAQGGQVPASLLLDGVAPSTLSRTINRHTAPSRLLRQAMVRQKIIAA